MYFITLPSNSSPYAHLVIQTTQSRNKGGESGALAPGTVHVGVQN
jgi:hypothetical protein